MIFPEFENRDVIDEIRNKYDPLAHLVEPHITLVFPFESEMETEELLGHLSECLTVPPFELELSGISMCADRFGNYLFLNVVRGCPEITTMHDNLYKGKLKAFASGYPYVPHLTVGKLPTWELLQKAYEDVGPCREVFRTKINKVAVEMIGEEDESNIVCEYELCDRYCTPK